MRTLTKAHWIVLLSGFVLSHWAYAHHSAAPFYDVSGAGEVEGEVVRVRWINPHVSIELSVLGEDGNEELWKLEGAAINTLERQGVARDSVSVGDKLRAVGYLSRRGRPEMFAGVLYFEDGRDVVLADSIAVDLGLRNEGVSTGEVIVSVADITDSVSAATGIFRVWSRRDAGYPRGPGSGFKFTQEALAAQEAWNPLTDDTGLQCIPQGMPGVIVNPYPVEFIDQGDQIVLRIEEWDTVRTIHMSDNLGAEPPATPLGYSAGHWEGNTLVVNTTRISWPYFDDIGTPQTESMEVEERFTVNDEGTRLDYVQTAFDPATLTEPAVRTGFFWLEEGEEIKPFNCTLSEE